MQKEEIIRKASKIFLWPNSLDELNRKSEKQYKLKGFNSVYIFDNSHNKEFGTKEFRKLIGLVLGIDFNNPRHEHRAKIPFPCPDLISRIYCHYKGYMGLVEAKRVHEPYMERVGEKTESFRSTGTTTLLEDVEDGLPSLSKLTTPIFQIAYRIGYAGLPVIEDKEKTRKKLLMRKF